MGAVTPFVPLIGSAIGLFGGRNVGGPSGLEKAMMSSGQAAGGQLVRQGTQLTATGRPLLDKASNYYQTILSGSRGAQQQLLAPEIGQITDTYRGAERGLERSGVRGPARDVATAELARDRAGAIAGLIPGLRPMAAAQIGDLGRYQTTAGLGATSAGASVYDSLLGRSLQSRGLQHEIGSDFGGGLGALTADLMKGVGTKKGAKMPGTPIPLTGFGPY